MDAVGERRDLPPEWLLEPSDYHAAAERALVRWPGPVGELIHRELSSYAAFGHRFATLTDTLMPHLATHVLGHEARDVPIRRPAPGPVLWPRPVP